MIEISEEICKTCKWHTEVGGSKRVLIACYYAGKGKGCRVYEKGKQRIDPKMCDKYVKGAVRPEPENHTFTLFGKGTK